MAQGVMVLRSWGCPQEPPLGLPSCVSEPCTSSLALGLGGCSRTPTALRELGSASLRRGAIPPLAQTLVHTETPSAVSCASAAATPLPLARALNPVNTGQMGTCRSQRLLRTTLIPTGKS